MKKISFITPLYFGKKYIKRLIRQAEKSFLLLKSMEKETQVEYIFVNDSPTEKIESFLIESKVLDKVKLITNNSNAGIHQARVNGLKESQGEYIYFLDQDDEIEEDFLLHMIKKIKNADIVICNGFRKTNQKLVPIYKTNIALFMTRFKRIYIYGTDMIFSPGQCLIRREAIPEIWKTHILTDNGCDDFYLWLSYFSNKKKIRCVYKKLYIHNEHLGNFSKNKKEISDSFEQLISLLEKKGGGY